MAGATRRGGRSCLRRLWWLLLAVPTAFFIASVLYLQATTPLVHVHMAYNHPTRLIPRNSTWPAAVHAAVARMHESQCSSEERFIHVFVAHFRNVEWLQVNLNNLLRFASAPECLELVVLTQEETPQERFDVVQAVGRRASVVHAPCHGKGGEPLPCVYRTAARLTDHSITVIADVDAVVLLPGWDDVVRDVFYGVDKVGLMGINPRGRGDIPVVVDADVFAREHKACFDAVIEWNWMAFRSWALRDDIELRMLTQFHERKSCDFGEYFTRLIVEKELKAFLFPPMYQPLAPLSPWICALRLPDGAGGENERPFVYHNFYMTRKQKDPLPESELRAIPSAAVVDCILAWLRGDAQQTTRPRCMQAARRLSALTA